jgi:hypothetical protein
MTVLEAIKANPILVNVPVNYIESVMISRSVSGSADYTESSLKDVELVSADLYAAIATLPEFKEGQLSLKYDSGILKSRALALYNKYDDDKAIELRPQPIIVNVTDVSNA